MMTAAELRRAMDAARRAVQAAAAASLRRWRGDLAVEIKADASPVTVADREAEAAILNILRAEFPDHGVLAEESGALGEAAPSRWIVDPLDGTRGFSRGGSFWGPLVALEERGEIVVGAMALPALGETYWAARGEGAFRDGDRLHVSDVSDWREATLSLGDVRRLLLEDPKAERIASLVGTCASVRGYGDLAACAELLNGRADAWMEAGVKVWDLAPLAVLVEEAGGLFVDLDGRATVHTGHAVATNGRLHHHVLAGLVGGSGGY